ncbi:3'(2'),5'-bisphosphate nucleotidase CysQ family protein [Photobacterium chitinilyticum]|uniref:Inositol-1-monophosphatase n=1 Tax=Photobacterium chitinilyticum TaxID=2485123 RepID=A0A444JS49_9GAMM|nr:inositol monophosphatase family protein [Photobacterium chitinilyticum]RWX55880.1 inositol-1-monophosphatase [Photobacterium chitinilyticum]
MELCTSQLEQLLALATEAALKAGCYISTFDRSLLQVDRKAAGNSLSSQVVTQVDLDSQTIILDVLQPSIDHYDLAVLSEENASEDNVCGHPRFQKAYYWCIDPLDGTLPFIEGSAGFAVSIALVSQSGEPVIGVVHNPVTGDTYQALNVNTSDEKPDVDGKILLKNSQLWLPEVNSQHFTLYIDRSFKADPRYASCIESLASLVKSHGYDELNVVTNCGAVMNAIGVFEHAPACYLKLPKAQKGGGSLWDFSATAAIARASSRLWVSNINGEPLDLNRTDSNFMNHKGVLYLNGIEGNAFLQEAASTHLFK